MITSKATEQGSKMNLPPTHQQHNANETKMEPVLTPAQLAALYGVDPKTMRKWLKKIEHIIGVRIGNFHSPQQVALIKREFGPPPDL